MASSLPAAKPAASKHKGRAKLITLPKKTRVSICPE